MYQNRSPDESCTSSMILIGNVDVDGNDRERVPKKMDVCFFKKKSVQKGVECVLNLSILERVPAVSGTFSFLKKIRFVFETRSVPFCFMDIFHSVQPLSVVS